MYELRTAAEAARFLELNQQCWITRDGCGVLTVQMYIVLPAGEYESATGWDDQAGEPTFSAVPMPDWCVGQTVATIANTVAGADLTAAGLVEEEERGWWHRNQEAMAALRAWFENQLRSEHRWAEERQQRNVAA